MSTGVMSTGIMSKSSAALVVSVAALALASPVSAAAQPAARPAAQSAVASAAVPVSTVLGTPTPAFPSGRTPALAGVVAPTATTSPASPAPTSDDSRKGGSEPAPGRRKPGWVWWVAAAFVVMLVAGALRLWRSTRD